MSHQSSDGFAGARGNEKLLLAPPPCTLHQCWRTTRRCRCRAVAWSFHGSCRAFARAAPSPGAPRPANAVGIPCPCLQTRHDTSRAQTCAAPLRARFTPGRGESTGASLSDAAAATPAFRVAPSTRHEHQLSTVCGRRKSEQQRCLTNWLSLAEHFADFNLREQLPQLGSGSRDDWRKAAAACAEADDDTMHWCERPHSNSPCKQLRLLPHRPLRFSAASRSAPRQPPPQLSE